MLREGFGVNLSEDEKAFMAKHIELVEAYGLSSNFPISDGEKLAHKERFDEIVEKLTPEEVREINEIQDRADMENLVRQEGDDVGDNMDGRDGDTDDNRGKVSMKSAVKNALQQGTDRGDLEDARYYEEKSGIDPDIGEKE